MRVKRTLAVASAGALLLVMIPTGSAVARRPRTERVRMDDRCDPETFNEALGEGACVEGGGNVTFQRFFNRLTAKPGKALRTRNVLGWRNRPRFIKIREGDRLLVKNTGGEFHTFTDVTEDGFGGGCVEELNEIFGLEIHPVCSVDDNGNNVPDWVEINAAPPGGSFVVSDLERGKSLFECLIHPWMRSTVRVRPS